MITWIDEPLFHTSSTHKDLLIQTDNGTYGNTDIHTESMELSESLCSEKELRFGCCESSEFRITLSNVFTSIAEKEIYVKMFLNHHSGTTLPIGKFKVVSDVPSADRNKREIIAYDKMQEIISADVASWYKGLPFPMTLKAFRQSFANHFGIAVEETVLVNDDMEVEETLETEEMSGKKVLEAIGEINGVFPHFTRTGFLRYFRLNALTEGLYPSDDLYPSNDLYPAEDSGIVIGSKERIFADYQDYKVRNINKLIIRQETGDVGVTVGTGNNAYVVGDNFLLYGKGAEELTTIANNMFSVIKEVSYRPSNITSLGNPCIELGDGIVVQGKYEIIRTYVLNRTLKGIQALRDNFVSTGLEKRSENVNSISKKIIQLQRKSNTLERTLEGTISTVSDLQTGYTQISQTVGSISSEVSSIGGDLSRLTQTVNGISGRVSTVEGNYSELSLTVNGLSGTISSVDGRVTTLSATVDNIDFTVENLGEESADLRIKVGEISTKVSTVEGNYSTLSQTVSGISSEVSKKVGNDEIISRINQSAEAITINASKINLEGYVTASSLSTYGFTCHGSSIGGSFTKIDNGGIVISFPGWELEDSTVLKRNSISTPSIVCSDMLVIYGQLLEFIEIDGHHVLGY